MLFKNAFHLMVDNFSLNYKMLLYKIVVGIVTVALCAALLYPTLRMLATSEPLKELLDLIREFLRAVVSGNTEFLQTFHDGLQESLSALVAYIGEKTPNLVFFCVSLVLIVLISRFLSGMGDFAFGVLIDDRMSSHANTAFFSAFIGNLGKAALWQVVYVPLTFVYDVLSLALCYVFFLILLNVISVGFLATVVALLFSVALLLAAAAVKMTLFSAVIPALVSDKMKLGAAMKGSFTFTKSRFSTLFSTYLVTCLLILCINALFALVTFGAALLITVPMSILMLLCIRFVSYYTCGQKKYFLAEDKIVQPKERTNENFYDDFEL